MKQAAIGLLLGVGGVACHGGESEPAPAPQPAQCPAGEWAKDGICIPAGLPPDLPCLPGEWLTEGGCVPAGVAPDGCGEGFVHDGDRGCTPVLPEEACGHGEF